jgi:hypothetical protein
LFKFSILKLRSTFWMLEERVVFLMFNDFAMKFIIYFRWFYKHDMEISCFSCIFMFKLPFVTETLDVNIHDS